jgi:hypothetical protein
VYLLCDILNDEWFEKRHGGEEQRIELKDDERQMERALSRGVRRRRRQMHPQCAHQSLAVHLHSFRSLLSFVVVIVVVTNTFFAFQSFIPRFCHQTLVRMPPCVTTIPSTAPWRAMARKQRRSTQSNKLVSILPNIIPLPNKRHWCANFRL